MNVSGPKDRATFSISADLKSRLETAIPKSERSRFVEQAIDEALRRIARNRLKTMLDELPAASSQHGSAAEFLRRQRMEWDGRPIEVLEGRGG